MNQGKLLLIGVEKVQSSFNILKGAWGDQELYKKVIPIIKIVGQDRDEMRGKQNLSSELRENHATYEADRIIREALEEAELLKKEVFEKTKEEAHSILENLKETTYQSAYQEGMEKGLVDGKKAGLEMANEECQLARDNAKTMLQNAHFEVQEIISRAQIEIIHLAIDIAKNLMNRVKLEDEGVLMDIARDAFLELKDKEQIIIHIHPSNKDVLTEYLNEIKEMCPKANLILLEDPTIDPIGCRLESETATIDTQMDSQLNKIREALMDMRNHHEL